MNVKQYFSLLDFVRFFAAFWVMNFHYFFVATLSSDIHWYRYGNLGVQLFFIISGFVIIHSLQEKNIGEFAKNRFIRIFPLFWILCTATFLLVLVVPNIYNFHISEYFINMTMFADIINEASHNNLRLIDASYWTLTVELIFYIAIGAFTYFFSQKRIRYFLFIWLIISVLAFIYKVNEDFYVKLFLVRHASYFIFGGSLALITIKQARNLFEKYFDWTLLLLSALYSIYIHPIALPPYANVNPLDQEIITGLLISFFIGVSALVYVSKYVTNKNTIKILAVLGGISYPLYLLHQTIGNVLMRYLTVRFDIPWNHFATGFEVFILIVAYFLYIQDKKMRMWLKKQILTSVQ